MNQEQFRDVIVDSHVKTINGGIGIVAKKWMTQLQILTWITPTVADYGHCSVYSMNEITEIVKQ